MMRVMLSFPFTLTALQIFLQLQLIYEPSTGALWVYRMGFISPALPERVEFTQNSGVFSESSALRVVDYNLMP